MMVRDIFVNALRHFFRRAVEPGRTEVVVDREIGKPFVLIIIAGNGDRDDRDIADPLVGDHLGDGIDPRFFIVIVGPRFGKSGFGEKIQYVMILVGYVIDLAAEPGHGHGEGSLRELVFIQIVRLQEPAIAKVHREGLQADGTAVIYGDRKALIPAGAVGGGAAQHGKQEQQQNNRRDPPVLPRTAVRHSACGGALPLPYHHLTNLSGCLFP